MTLFHCKFDVLWIMVASPNFYQVFDTTRHKYFTFADKTQISCTQKRTVPMALHIRPERFLGLFWTIPISLSDTRARRPYLAYFLGLALITCVWIYNDNPLFPHNSSATHQFH